MVSIFISYISTSLHKHPAPLSTSLLRIQAPYRSGRLHLSQASPHPVHFTAHLPSWCPGGSLSCGRKSLGVRGRKSPSLKSISSAHCTAGTVQAQQYLHIHLLCIYSNSMAIDQIGTYYCYAISETGDSYRNNLKSHLILLKAPLLELLFKFNLNFICSYRIFFQPASKC